MDGLCAIVVGLVEKGDFAGAIRCLEDEKKTCADAKELELLDDAIRCLHGGEYVKIVRAMADVHMYACGIEA